MARKWVRGSVVGAGSFGTVSLAMNRANGELFAVKSIECIEAATRELEALDNEAMILKDLNSPWIVKFLGYGFSEENGSKMKNLFMEYMAGGSVADILKKFGGRLDESVIRTYTRGLLQGIHYLHSRGIVHCDIKGKNVLLGGGSAIKLADFGCAKKIDDLNVNDQSVHLRGTPLWMAPEAVRQEMQGPPSDIWSLGCTVFEMATGSPPWSHISHPLVAMFKIGCSDESPELPKGVSEQCVDFLEKCFRRDPKQRWTSAQLLQHPFITEMCNKDLESEGPRSPTSALDSQFWDSGSLNVLDLDNKRRPTPTAGIWKGCPIKHAEKVKNATELLSMEEEMRSSPGPLALDDHWITVKSEDRRPAGPTRSFTDLISDGSSVASSSTYYSQHAREPDLKDDAEAAICSIEASSSDFCDRKVESPSFENEPLLSSSSSEDYCNECFRVTNSRFKCRRKNRFIRADVEIHCYRLLGFTELRGCPVKFRLLWCPKQKRINHSNFRVRGI